MSCTLSFVKIWSGKYFYDHSSTDGFNMNSCQLMAKECTLSTGKLPLGGLPRNSVVRITDCHPSADTSSAVYRGSKAINQSIS